MNSSPVWEKRPERSKLVSPEHWGMGPGKGIIENSSGHWKWTRRFKIYFKDNSCTRLYVSNQQAWGEWINVYIWRGPSKKQESSRKTSISALLTMPKLLTVDHNKPCKILKEMGIPDHLTCLLRNLYADQEATVRTGHGTTDWFKIGKGVHQGWILSPCLFNLYSECIMRNAGLDET